jgi:Ribbon-helix-helix protein, copG family
MKPGRPPLDRTGQPSASVHLKLPAEEYDRLAALARLRRESLQALIRQALTRVRVRGYLDT